MALLLMVVPAAGAHIYWPNFGNDTIGRANLDGSAATHSFISGASLPYGVAADGLRLYWGNFGASSIGRANLDGTGVNHSFLPGASSPVRVAVDGAHVYWTNNGTNTIARANLDGSGANYSFISGATGPFGVDVDGAHVYWATTGPGAGIGRANLDGSAVDHSFITGLNSPRGVAVAGSHIYWTDGGTNTIGRANLDGSAADHSFITASDPYGIAVDGAHVYWTSNATDTIGRAKLDGSAVDHSFITGASNPLDVAVTPLETSITQGPAGTVGQAGASFSFSASEPAGFECRLDNQPFAACGSPKTYSALANGRHTFQVRARDAAGNVDPTPATRSWSVNAIAPAIVDTTKPVLSALRLSRSVLAAAASGPSIKAKPRTDTKVSYRLTERAGVRFQILRRNAGRTVNGKCRPRTRANRRRRSCDLPLKGSLRHHGAQGNNSLRFRGRLRGRKLKPGRYYLVAAATDAANNHSTRRRATFRIVKR